MRSSPDPDPAEVEAIIEAFVPWADLSEEAGEGPSWLLSGYVAAGYVTLLAGKPKAGKSTLACAIAEAVDDIEMTRFLDRYVGWGPVVYVSEEGAVTLAPKLRRGARSVALTRERIWPKPPWAELIEAAVGKATDIEAVLLVIDALSFWASFREGQENDTGAMQATMDALGAATRADLAVLLVHHQRKSGGNDGDAIRGAGAILGAVDAVIELERLGEGAPATQRRLVTLGRWDSPPVLVVDHEAGSWRVVGSVADRGAADAFGIRERILAALPTEPPGLTENELASVLDLDKRKVSNPLRRLVDKGRVVRTGGGKKGNPYRYAKPPRKLPSAGAESQDEMLPSPVGGAASSNVSSPKVPHEGRNGREEVERIVGAVARAYLRSTPEVGLDSEEAT